MIHILQKKILIVCLFTLNCVVLIIPPLSQAPLASPLDFFFRILGGNSSGGGGALTPPPLFTSAQSPLSSCLHDP